MAHVQQTINLPDGKKDGFKHFKRKKSVRSYKDVIETPFGRFFGDGAREKHNLMAIGKSEEVPPTKTDSELLELLQAMISKKLEEHGFDADTIAKFDGQVMVNSVNAGNIKGSVNCIICREQKLSKKTISVYFDNRYWVPSNFVTHLNRCHLLHSTPKKTIKQIRKGNRQSKPKTQSQSNENASSSKVVNPNESEHDSGENPQKVGLNSIEIIEVDVNDETGWESFDESSIIQELTEEEIEGERVQEIEEGFEKEEIVLGEKDEIVYTQISEQESTMRSVALANGEKEIAIPLKDVDQELIGRIGTCDINADGNCLFGAAAHQLFHEKIGSVISIKNQ